MGIFRRRDRSSQADQAGPGAGTPAPPPDGLAAQRLQAFEHLGAVSELVLAPIIAQDLLGDAPSWPGREGHRVIVTQDAGLIFATDGLTDAYADGAAGLGYELMMKVPKPRGLEDPLRAGAMFEFGVHREFALNALTWPDLRPLLRENGVLSMVLPGDPGASPFVSDAGMVGALLGAETRNVSGVMVIGITLILPSEVRALEAGGPETRPWLAGVLADAGIGWTSISNRSAVA